MASYWLLTLDRWFWGMGVLTELGAWERIIVGGLLPVGRHRACFCKIAELPRIAAFRVCGSFFLGGVDWEK